MDRNQLTIFKRASSPYQRGVTLIELMIGMVIGLVLLGGIMQTMLASKEAAATRQSISTITDNARFLFDFMARDLRMGGRGYGSDDWEADAPDGFGSNLDPIEFIDNELVVRYLGQNNTPTEVRYRLDGNEVEYCSSPCPADNKNFEPLIGGVDSFGFAFALCNEPDVYVASNTDWPNVTAVQVTVGFVDEAPWAGEGIDRKEISSTVALRNRVSGLILDPDACTVP